ncbi:MAG TPA: PIN domain-containing protein [Candidatus Eisenbacteria bacterium]
MGTGVIALDASALLAWLFREPRWEIVDERLAEGAISTVNLAEVLCRLRRDDFPSHRMRQALEAGPLDIVPSAPTMPNSSHRWNHSPGRTASPWEVAPAWLWRCPTDVRH